MPQFVPPSLGAASFNCPHCEALSHQSWFKHFLLNFASGERPCILSAREIPIATTGESFEKLLEIARFRAIASKKISLHNHGFKQCSAIELLNVHVSECYSCKQFSVWVADDLVHPKFETEILPHKDMPEEIKFDFLEAAGIVAKSPRGAAALLRLCIQKLMIVLGQKGNDINADIAGLVKEGLDKDIQQALDVVRVVGNDAVHPGRIDLRDDLVLAMSLFKLVNLVVERMISGPKHVKELFEALPEGKRSAIALRDGDGS